MSMLALKPASLTYHLSMNRPEVFNRYCKFCFVLFTNLKHWCHWSIIRRRCRMWHCGWNPVASKTASDHATHTGRSTCPPWAVWVVHWRRGVDFRVCRRWWLWTRVGFLDNVSWRCSGKIKKMVWIIVSL